MLQQNIVLIGMPGAGKSTIGVLLAKTLGMAFVDTDLVIQEKAGRLLQEIINQDGVGEFLKLEAQIISELEVKRSVIATGGSAVYSQEAVRHLQESSLLLYLKLRYDEIEQRMKAFSQKRWDSQPAAPSAGCCFKNPVQIPAGRLIDELGLKGMRVGGAMVSLEHGNFIINDGTATARDVLELIAVLKSRAQTERGIELHTEVEIVGEDEVQ